MSIPLLSFAIPYKLIWHFQKNGIYSVKSGYRVAHDATLRVDGGIGTSHGGRDTLWTSMWSLPIPNKIKIFLWPSSHGLLPCMANLFFFLIIKLFLI